MSFAQRSVDPTNRFSVSTGKEVGKAHPEVQLGDSGVDRAKAPRLLEVDQRPFVFTHVPRDVASQSHCNRVVRVQR